MKSTLLWSLALFGTVTSVAQANPLDLVLKIKERVPVEELANSVMNPRSPRFQRFFTPDEIRDISGPTDADYQRLLANLRSRGFEIVAESRSHLYLTVRTDTTTVPRNFNTQVRTFGPMTVGTTTMPSIPTDLSIIQSVTGFDQSPKLHPHFNFANAQIAAPNPLTAQKNVKHGYGFDPIYQSGITGANQDIAIATYGGFHMSDVTAFAGVSNLSPGAVYDQVVFNGKPKIDEDAAVETELDAEFSGMMAPGAHIHIFASAENSSAGELAMFSAILDDNRSKVVNYSWGTCEDGVDSTHKADMDKVFARAVAQGVNILVASGDSGAKGCANSSKFVADWPASSPNVVAVGGTSFSISNSGQLSEAGWSGSGGGISKFYPTPNYQKSSLSGQFNMRSFPDVSFSADQSAGQQVYTSCNPSRLTGACKAGKPGWLGIGGTSMAAPQWAGFLALVNESRARAGKGPLGFINPILYSMSPAMKAKVLHDVKTGNNGYPAGPGWDAVTGLGSMQADTMLDYLTSI